MNRLTTEKSPYLQQHKNNPVDWYPWGEEAFEKARKENKPIFLSIGYSSCHWCHVMEHESFEDSEVAKILNEGFVSIKVDREERPDIDSIYMLVCQMMTGHGGWPLSIFMNASKQAFFAGTYFPKTTTQGRLGFSDVLKRILHVWSHQKKDLHATIQNIQVALQESQKHQPGNVNIKEILDACVGDLKNMFDPIRGGFGQKPKFPSPHKLLFLMTHYRWSRDSEVLNIIEKTLQEMHRGGIFDHIRGGFHRYSTDENWELPHFEKMLYDQALCARIYLEAYQITRNEFYRAIGEKTIQYVLSDLKDSDGYFMSAYDADSEGEEGAYYTWAYSDLKKVLSAEEFQKLEKYFDVREEGNFLDEATHEPVAKNILFLKQPISSIESGYFSLEKIFEKLKNQVRVQPLCDHKVLADWNSLFLQTLWIAYDVTGDDSYKKTAVQTLKKLESSLFEKDKVYHRLCEGEILKKEFLDDIAGAISVYIAAYRSTHDESFLEKASDLADYAIQDFYDPASGGFHLTPQNQNELTVRTKDFYDGAYPSANSFMIENMVHLWNITGQSKYKKVVETFLENSTATLAQSPTAFCYVLRALRIWIEGALEIQVQGLWDEKSKAEIESILRDYFLPEKYLKITESENRQIQICRGMSCGLPLLEISTFKKELRLLYNP